MSEPLSEVVHASCVSLLGRGILILGPSGAGKSSLALRLMALGAELVADDRTALRRDGGDLIASAPPGLPHLIEARGIGLLHATLLARTKLVLVVELTDQPLPRLPPISHTCFIGCPLDIVRGAISDHLAVSIRQYALAGREA